jgi:hypothetical protein
MTLHLHILAPNEEMPPNSLAARSGEELIPFSSNLVKAQQSLNHDLHIWLADERLIELIPTPLEGLREIHRPKDLLSQLEDVYSPLPSALTLDLARRWLYPPHLERVPLLRLLLSRVLGLPELATPDANVPLTSVVEALVRSEAELREPLVCQAWMEYGPTMAVGTIDKPGALCDPYAAPSLLVMSLLSSYPRLLRTGILDELHWTMPGVRGLEALLTALTRPDPHVLGLQRLEVLTTLLRTELETLPTEGYLVSTSGRLKVELDVLLERVGSLTSAIPLSVEDIRSHFAWLLDNEPVAAEQFQSFCDILTIAGEVEIPQVSAETIDDARSGLISWKSFFVQKFLPALGAWRRLGRPQKGLLAHTLFSADAAFARWISAAYPKLKSLPSSPSSPLAYREIRRLAKPSPGAGSCIVLLIDGLAYEMAEILQKEANTLGIWILEPVPAIASLPTITDVGMLATVAGLPVDMAWLEDSPQTENARRRREELLRQRVPQAVVKSVFQIEQMTEALAVQSDLYILVWSDVDSFAHRYTDPGLFVEHARVSLRYVLQELVKAVKSQPYLQQQKDQLRLLISADHGWTDLLKDEPVARPNIIGAQPHHRLYEVSRSLNMDERANLASDWVIVSGTDYDLPIEKTYLIPIENRAVARRVVRQHGGLSLSEVFVPIMVGGFGKPHYLDIIVRATAVRPLQKEQNGEVRLVLNNPNQSEVTNIRIYCEQLNMRVRIDSIQAHAIMPFGPFQVCPQVSGPVDTVEMVLNYEGRTIGPLRLNLLGPLSVERTPEERMAGDYSQLDSLFE